MMQTKVLTLPKIGCQGCMKKVVRALEMLPGLAVVQTDVSNKAVTIQFDEQEITLPKIAEVLGQIGHTIAGEAAGIQ
ncbi:Cu2+-exporting ATPase [Thermosporothrix hazakensis]|jgi:copper chaperone CopZ|uniref:Cu2+-exporting ATPase n=1 Tax=Thermosporothrix hazakensis TaxID=644383 RepID=A0A326U5H2_THEHA|nr:heavy-metal-associated domain-containing protein [Thermosporothrix hazakensis]PZW29180.1 Cu2+-exporting ATPase [Thermosporothrix hazakensis]GCE45468.1 hypothetical protein KTH_03370 [Thermosporothrix hazakensis]